MRDATTGPKRLAECFGEVMGLSSSGDPYRSGFGKRYDFSFVWFKPFVKISSRKITDFQPRVAGDRCRPDSEPFKNLQHLFTNEGEVWSWDYVSRRLDCNNVGEIEIGYSSLWGGLVEKYSNLELGRKIDKFCEQENLAELDDNTLSTFEIRILSDVLRQSGFDDIVFFNVFTVDPNEDFMKLSLDDGTKFPELKIPQFASDEIAEYAVCTYFNDFFATIHGPEKLAENIRKNARIEGFFCNEKTNCDWFLDIENQMGERKYISDPEEPRASIQ